MSASGQGAGRGVGCDGLPRLGSAAIGRPRRLDGACDPESSGERGRARRGGEPHRRRASRGRPGLGGCFGVTVELVAMLDQGIERGVRGVSVVEAFQEPIAGDRRAVRASEGPLALPVVRCAELHLVLSRGSDSSRRLFSTWRGKRATGPAPWGVVSLQQDRAIITRAVNLGNSSQSYVMRKVHCQRIVATFCLIGRVLARFCWRLAFLGRGANPGYRDLTRWHGSGNPARDTRNGAGS